MIERTVIEKLRYNIATVPAVALLGPRRVGKTTLAKQISKWKNSIYLDLESPADTLMLEDPVNFLSQSRDKLIILDEIQQAPEIFRVIRGVIDSNAELGKKSSQFLLLGSASMDLLGQSSESLAGRISYIPMTSLNLLEMDEPEQNISKLWLRGGFPDSYLSHSNYASMDWLKNLILNYLQRDIPQLGFRVPAERLRRLWIMLSHLQGQQINYTSLAGNLEVDQKTIKHYIDILVDLLLVRRLEPWHENVKKRLVKSPRYYVKDSGILHALLGIREHDSLISHPICGKSWEGFVIENIHAVLPNHTETYFYRTSSGAEIDLVIRFSNGLTWAVEIKYGSSPKVDNKFSKICDDVNASRKYIIYGGNKQFMIKNDVTVISLFLFLQELYLMEKEYFILS